MPTTYQWRPYVEGQADPPYQFTTTLNDGAAFDHATHANGLTENNASSDYYSGGLGPSIRGGVDVLMTFDTPILMSAITFSVDNGHITTPVEGGFDIVPRFLVEGTNNATGLLETIFDGSPSDLGAAAHTRDLQVNIIPEKTYRDIRLRHSVIRTSNIIPPVYANVYDLRFIGAVCVPPGAPAGFNLSSVAESGGTVKFTLQWNDSPTGNIPITYELYRVEEPGADTLIGTKVSGVDTTPYTLEDPGQSFDDSHGYYVLPRNDCGVGTPTATLCGSLPGATNPPNNFRGVEECEGNQVSLFWDLPATPPLFDGFRIRRDGVLFATLGANIQTWVDTAPGINVQHIYSIVAYNTAGESSPASLTIIACEWEGCVEDALAGTWSVIA